MAACCRWSIGSQARGILPSRTPLMSGTSARDHTHSKKEMAKLDGPPQTSFQNSSARDSRTQHHRRHLDSRLSPMCSPAKVPSSNIPQAHYTAPSNAATPKAENDPRLAESALASMSAMHSMRPKPSLNRYAPSQPLRLLRPLRVLRPKPASETVGQTAPSRHSILALDTTPHVRASVPRGRIRDGDRRPCVWVSVSILGTA
jgi:hypothetical protein